MGTIEAIYEVTTDEFVPPRPLWLIDKQGRIRWAAGIEAASGMHCWEALACAATSRRTCKAIRLDQFRAPDGCLDHEQAAYPAGTCLILPIPRPSKELLVCGPQGSALPTGNSLFVSLFNLASAIISSNLIDGTNAVAELIRITTGADNCELFLADMSQRGLLLTACVGSDRKALLSRSRFEPGEGLPGLAFAKGRPVTTLRLDPKDRFPCGEHSPIVAFLSVPITAPDGHVIGCINLAWRHRDVPVQRLANTLWEAVPTLGSAICASYWTYRQRVISSAERVADRATLSLQAVLEAVGADAACLVEWSERDYKAKRTHLVGSAPPTCHWLASPEAAPCLSRTNKSGFRTVALDKTHDNGPEPCKQMCFSGVSACCIPIVGLSGRIGRLLVGFRTFKYDHSGRLLVPLQIMAEEVSRNLPEPTATVYPPFVDVGHPQLNIRCFGEFEVSIGENKLDPQSFPRRDALTLLKILVLRAGKQLHRERLIDWLWPEADDRSGLNRLHGVIHTLRRVIEPHASKRRWIYLVNEGETYSFLPGDTASVDVISFQENIALADRDLHQESFAPHATHYLEQAVELYRGDLYENDQYSEWCDVERVTLQREFLDALANLARIYLTHGEGERAVKALRKALTYDDSREDLHNELVRCLMRQRRYKEAKDQVRECLRCLCEDVGVEPSSETLRLYHSLFQLRQE